MSFIPSDLNPGIAWFRAVPHSFKDAGINKAITGDTIYRFIDQVNPNKYFEWTNSVNYDMPILSVIDSKIGMDFTARFGYTATGIKVSKLNPVYMGGFPLPSTNSEPTLMCTVKPQWSMSFWVKMPSTMGNPGTVFAESNAALNGPLYAFGNKAGQNSKFAILIRNGSTALLDKTSDKVVFDDAWHHIAITDDNGQLKLYIDGVLDITDFTYIKPQTFTQPASRQAFGIRPQSPVYIGNSFITKGYIGDNIVMDDKIWTQEDITNLFNYG